MESYPRILIGTDGSAGSKAAARIGGKIAARLGVPVTIISAWEDDEAAALRACDDAKTVVAGFGVTDITISTPQGDPTDALLAADAEDPEALLVVGSAGLDKVTSRIVGSTSNRLAHSNHTDVLFARDPAPDRFQHVALATDGSSTSHEAVRKGFALAVALHARPRLITAAKSQQEGDQAIAEIYAELSAAAPDVEIQREVLIDSQAASAVAGASWKYELLVIGNKSMTGPSRLLPGSFASRITHSGEANILLINTTSE